MTLQNVSAIHDFQLHWKKWLCGKDGKGGIKHATKKLKVISTREKNTNEGNHKKTLAWALTDQNRFDQSIITQLQTWHSRQSIIMGRKLKVGMTKTFCGMTLNKRSLYICFITAPKIPRSDGGIWSSPLTLVI